MGTKHITNDGPNTIYVGGKMIAPGEGRDIDERDLPPELRDAPAPVVEEAGPSLDDELCALLKESVKEIKDLLPGLTNEGLDRLAELERCYEHPRKTLLEAIADEAIRRADEALQGDDPGADSAAGAGGDDVNVGV